MKELQGIIPKKRKASAIEKMSNVFFGNEDAAVDGVYADSNNNSFEQGGFEKDHILEE